MSRVPYICKIKYNYIMNNNLLKEQNYFIRPDALNEEVKQINNVINLVSINRIAKPTIDISIVESINYLG